MRKNEQTIWLRWGACKACHSEW